MGISKTYRIVDQITGLSKTYNVRGFRSAKLVLEVTAGTVTIGAYGTINGSNPTTSSPRVPLFYNGVEYPALNISMLGVGRHEIFMSLELLGNILINTSQTGFEGKITFSAFYEELAADKKIEADLAKGGSLVKGGHVEIIRLTKDAKQLDVSVKFLNRDITSTNYVRLTGQKENDDWVSVPFLETNDGVVQATRGWVPARPEPINLYANVEEFKTVRVHIDAASTARAEMKISVSEEYKEREFRITLATGLATNKFFDGYRYLDFDIAGTKVTDGSLRLNLYNAGSASGDPVTFNLFTKNMEPLRTDWFITNPTQRVFEIFGTVLKGGFILEFNDPLPQRPYLWGSTHNTLSGFTTTITYKVKLSNKRPVSKSFPVVKEANDYKIHQLPSSAIVKDTYRNDVVEYSPNEVLFYMGGYHGVSYRIPFTVENVPTLKTGEVIKFAYLLPFNVEARAAAVGSERGASRIVVFTNKGRVFHNFPARSTGSKPFTDLYKFDESAIYNSAKKWMPTNDKAKATGVFRYFPVLAEYDYDQLNGRVAGTPGFVDHFNSGGIPAITNRPLYTNNMADIDAFVTLKYSSMAKDSKLSVFGNYNNDVGVEPIVFGTNDGGRTFYTKAYFACVDTYNYMRSGKVTFDPITAAAGAYVPNSLRMGRKRFNVPTNANKEPATPFVVLESDKTLITSMSVGSNGTVQITTADPVDYDGVFSAVYLENVSANSEWNFVCNTGFTANGVTNNGIFFRAEKLSANTYRLYADLGDAYQSDLICRHIHAVNRTQGGFLISTGEGYSEVGKYAGGFIYYMEQLGRNGGNTYSAIDPLPVKRLNSSESGIIRAAGAYLLNDSGMDPTLLVASDESFTARKVSIAGRTVEINLSSVGLFAGKLSDIDDISKFECVCDVKQTLVSLVEHMGHFACDGHFGALVISKDGKNWNIETNEPANSINGTDMYGNIYFGDKVIVFK